MNKSLLVKIFGFHASLIHGDTLVLDRWRWLRKRLPVTRDGKKFIDIGCGTGAFTIGAARRGYTALGLSWDERNQTIATQRAKMCKAPMAKFEIFDVRLLHERRDLIGDFDIAICFENIEHIFDDRKLINDISNCLVPGGRLFLSSPYFHYRPITSEDIGPMSKIEDGGHVRRGYSKAMLEELCGNAGLVLENVSFCSGFLSQKLTFILRKLSRINHFFAWAVVTPFRWLPPMLDRFVTPFMCYPYYSICIEVYKPRFSLTRNAKLEITTEVPATTSGR
jgi:SAM-dependent methyltransferase